MTEQSLTPEQLQTVLLFQIEQAVRKKIANEIENVFHGKYHNESHEIAEYLRRS